MKLKAISAALLLTGFAVGGAHAGIVRIAPIRVVPIILPGFSTIIMPLSFAIPTQGPILPVIENPLAPSIGLPGVRLPVVSPNPIEQPQWPVVPIALIQARSADKVGAVAPIALIQARSADKVGAVAPRSPISMRIKDIRKKLRLDDAHRRPSRVRLDVAYDGLKDSDATTDVVEEPEPARPSIDWPSRPVTLPEDDLLRELGL